MNQILISIAILFSAVDCHKLKLVSLEKCDPDAEYPVEIITKIVEKDDEQYCEDGWVKTPEPLGTDKELVMEIFIYENDKYNYFMTVRKNLCYALYHYAPDMVYELQDLVGIPRDSCPIPAGEYHIQDYLIDFNKLKINLDLIDDGLIKSVSNLMDIATNTSLNCMVTEILKTSDE